MLLLRRSARPLSLPLAAAALLGSALLALTAGPAPLSADDAAVAPAALLPQAGQASAEAPEAAPEAPAEQEATLERVASVEGMTQYRLSNGLEVLLVPSESAGNTTVVMTYFVGSRHEGYGESGDGSGPAGKEEAP